MSFLYLLIKYYVFWVALSTVRAVIIQSPVELAVIGLKDRRRDLGSPGTDSVLTR
jgi:hypothetical protein